jgi:hypothetical protein
MIHNLQRYGARIFVTGLIEKKIFDLRAQVNVDSLARQRPSRGLDIAAIAIVAIPGRG